MLENEKNAELEVIEETAENGGAAEDREETEENAAPQEETQTDIEGMSDEEFDEYLKSVKRESAPEAAPEPEKNAEPDRTKAEETAKETDTQKPYRTFRTQADWQKTIDNIVKDRLKNAHKSREKLESVIQLASEFYDSEDADEDEVIERLVNDLRNQNADKRGIDVETYAKSRQDAIDAKRYREEQRAAQERDAQIQAIRDRWDRESAALKKIAPDFDLERALGDERFYNMLVNGESVSMAYLACNQQRNAANTQTQSAAAPPKRRSIQQNGNMRGGGTGTVNFNPATASDADFLSYINKIKNRN